MPTNKQRIVGAIVSIGITIGGAWVASTAHSKTEDVVQSSFSEGLNITLENIRNDAGNVVVMVFSNREAFNAYDVTKAAGYKEVPARIGEIIVEFRDLKSGPYAVVAFHDEDKNRDLNMDGEWPTEGYATSGAVDAYDTPTFRSASLRKPTVSIEMYYAD